MHLNLLWSIQNLIGYTGSGEQGHTQQADENESGGEVVKLLPIKNVTLSKPQLRFDKSIRKLLFDFQVKSFKN